MAEQSDDSDARWRRTLTIAIPVALLAAVVIYQQRQAAELARADQARAEEIRAESRARRERDNEDRTARLDARVETALTQLQSDQPTIQCQGALQLGRVGTQANVATLEELVYSARSSVRICAVSAIASLGDTSKALGVYELWTRETDADLRRAAITGFGQIGAGATDVALPYLERELRSEYTDIRYLVVETLSKLGPAADTLLMEAARDTNVMVRERAAAVLKARKVRE